MSGTNPYRAPSVADSFAPQAPAPPPDFALTPGVMEALKQTRPWVTLLAIFGFLAGLFFMVAAVSMVVAGAVGGFDALSANATLGVGIGYALFVPMYVIPSFLLLRYGSEIGRFLKGDGIPALEGALRAQKSFWKTVGFFATACMLLLTLGTIGIVTAAILKISLNP